MTIARIFCRMSLVLALVTLATPGAAEPLPGSRIDSAPGSVRSSDVEAEDAQERVMQTYLACVARSRRDEARRLLDLPYLSPEQHRAAARIMRSECLGATELSLRLRAPHVVGRIAEFFFLERYANEDLSRFAGLSDEAADALGLVPRNNAEDLAFCMLRADPQAVRALIGSRWGSAEQAAAVRRVTPHLGACVTAGETLDLNARALRLLLASGLHRAVTVAPAPAPAG